MVEFVYVVSTERDGPKLHRLDVLKKGPKEFHTESHYAIGHRTRHPIQLYERMESPRAAWEHYRTRANMEMNSCLAMARVLQDRLIVVEKELLALDE